MSRIEAVRTDWCRSVLQSMVALIVCAPAFWQSADAQDNEPPMTTIEVPARDEQLQPGSLVFSGAATDNGGTGVSRTMLMFRKAGDSRWYNPESGTFDADRATQQVAASVTGQGTASATWSYTAPNVPVGSWQVYAISRDGVRWGLPWTTSTFTVLDSGADNEPPVTTIEVPARDEQLQPGPLVFSGAATDNGGTGVSRTMLMFRKAGDSRWYNPESGTFDADRAAQQVAASVTGQGTASATWSYTAPNVPVGSWQVYAISRDGVRWGLPWTTSTFTVLDSGADNEPPMTTIEVPARDEQLQPGSLVFSGAATDNGGTGVSRTMLMFRKAGDSRWYNPESGTFDADRATQQVAASVTGQGTASATWSYTAPNVPVGSWQVYAISRDGVRWGLPWTTSTFTVLDSGADNEPPVTTIEVPARDEQLQPGPLVFSGAATDNGGTGVSRTMLMFRKAGDSRWYNPESGTFDADRAAQQVAASVTGQGTASATWSYTAPNVPVGSWQVYAISRDGVRWGLPWTTSTFTVLDSGLGTPPAPPQFPAGG